MFENIESYYDYIEKDNRVLNDYSLSNNIKALIDKIQEKEVKVNCLYELYFNDFQTQKGNIKPKLSYGNGQQYPDFILFEDDLAYIKSRAISCINPKFKAKYNHLVWASKHRHAQYGEQAIDSYFATVKTVSFPIEDIPENRTFATYFENLFSLSLQVNYLKDEVIQFLTSMLGANKVSGYIEYQLMNCVAEEGKQIKHALQYFYNYSKKVIENSIHPEFIEEFLKLQVILCQKLNLSPKEYHNRYAEFYLQQAVKHGESFIAHDIYLRALTQYQKAGNKEKIEEVTVLIEKAKKNVNFKTIKVEYTNDLTQKWHKMTNDFTDNLVEKFQSKDIYQFLIASDRIFPKAEILNQTIRPAMLELIHVTTFDINKNVNDGKKSGINPYFVHVQNFSITWLGMIFSKGIKNGKISYQTLIEYLENYTWYGIDATFVNADGESEGFNWIELISASLESFFNQFEIDLKAEKNENQGYILAIDSLVLKFEGLLREFSRMIGAQTIEIKANGTQERISFEKLLDNPKLKQIIPVDDIALFKFLFTSEGMNLRNNIAHCFYKTKNYSSGIMVLIISAVLKLGNYKPQIASN